VAFDSRWLEPFFSSPALRKAALDFRQDQWAAAESGFTKGASRLAARSDERQAARFLTALAKANQSKWAEAAALFEALYRDYPRLGPYHAYNAARSRLREGDLQAALDWAAKVPVGSVSDAEAALVALDALRGLSRWKDAAGAAAAFLARYPQGPRRPEAAFKQAEAMEKVAAESRALEIDADLADITALYRRVWADAPLDDWSKRAEDRLEAIATALPPGDARLVRTRIAAEWFARGMVYFDRNRNTESEAAFTSAVSAPGLNNDLDCRVRYHRAQSVWKQRQRPRAAPLFDEAEIACARAGNNDLHAKALYQGGRSWASGGDRARALAHYARLEAEHATHSYADDACLRSAELATDGGDEATANKLLTELTEKYPKADLLGEAYWRLAFSAWRVENYDEALRWLDENLKRIPHEEIWYAEGRALYWKARVLERKKDEEAARVFYARAIREYPLSVYALLAFGRIGQEPQATQDPKDGRSRKERPARRSPEERQRERKDQKVRAQLLVQLRDREKAVSFHFAPRPLFGEDGFRRAVDLARMGQGGDARRELARMGLQTSGDKHAAGTPARRDEEDLLWIATVLLDKAGVWNASHSIPRYTLDDYRLEYPKGLGTTKWRLSYPRAFADLIAKNSRANQIPEALQLAIVREESAFSPRIESFANAIGLTQMLIKTARRFSNGAAVTRESLMDPVKNLEYGSRFLGFLWTHFGKAAPLSIAGYNAGEGAVDRWLGERGQLDMDEFMETIPYDETRNYTKRVLASFFAYSWLYDDKDPVPAIPQKTIKEANKETNKKAKPR
ncbi:MAG: tetratricopeptide repeat protein, partial [Deltaproteobacteria bacterium]|nr:tetratricopeptide repeat protein [Deltaproteobacteria bacterium]